MNRFQIILVATSLVVGAFNTLGFTLQNKQVVREYNIQKQFFHPYMQAFMVFVSGLPSMFIYIWRQYAQKHKQQNQQERQAQKQKPHILIYLIPTLFDYSSTISFLIALNFISGSVYTNLRGGVVLTTFMFSYIFLKAAPTRSRIIGCIIVVLGLVVVGVTNLQFSTDSDSTRQEILIGYALIIFALIGNSLQFVCEEYLMTKYEISPFFIVGINGVYGIIISLILIPLLAITPCYLGPDSCVIDQSGSYVVENAFVYFRQVGNNNFILAGVISTFITMAIYNIVGVTITKEINSVARAICDVSRTAVVWTIGIIVTVTAGRTDGKYILQSLNAWQLLGEGIGFIILIIGNLIYYQVIKRSCNKTQDNQEVLIQPTAQI